MVSNIAIADFCKVIEQESMGKPVFLHLMFKAFKFSCNLECSRPFKSGAN